MSIVEVAKRAGVSKSTVSLVINNSTRVAPETAEKVRSVMAKMGYVPRPPHARRGPKRSRSSQHDILNLALVTLGIHPVTLRYPVYAEVLNGVEQGARELGHQLVVHHAHDAAAFGMKVFGSRVDGVILFGNGETSTAERELRRHPCVSVMRVGGERSWTDWISYDGAAAGRLAAEHLLAAGHRQCAVIGRKTERTTAFLKAVRAAGGKATVLGTQFKTTIRDGLGIMDPDWMDGVAGALLKIKPRVTGVFCWADGVTVGLYHALQRRGIAPGEKLTVVSCNNERPLLAGLYPRPAAVDLQAFEIGRRAAAHLVWRRENPDRPRVVQLLDPQLVVPESDEGGTR